MKLTNYIRDAFVHSVMNDVPKIDYKQQIRDTALKVVVDAMPAKLRAVWGDPELQSCIKMNHIYVADCMRVFIPNYPGVDKVLAAHKEEWEALHALHHAQEDKLHTLCAKIRSVAYSAKTRKALVDMLPEFEKYLPKDDAAALRTVPAIANVMEELVAAGWPKEQTA